MTGRLERLLAAPATHGVLAAALGAALLVVLAGHNVLPRLVSADGWLVRAELGLGSLSLNHARLDLPAHRFFSRVEAELRLEDGEALSLVVGAPGSKRRVVFRASRFDELPPVRLDLEQGEAVARREIPWPEPGTDGSWEIQLERDGDGLRLLVGGVLVDAVQMAGPLGLDVVLFPPSSPQLHGRCDLTRVLLDGGEPLATRPWHGILTSPWLLAALGAALVIALGRPLGALASRVWPRTAREQPAAVGVWLLGALAIVGLFRLIPVYEQLRAFTSNERNVYRVFVLGALVWCLAFFVLRDRLLAASPRLARSWLGRVRGLPASFVLATLLFGVLFVAVFTKLFVSIEPDPTAVSTGGPGLRVAVYGGSSTRGYPYPAGWSGTFVDHLRRSLEERETEPVRVWNLGVDAANLADFEARLPADLERLKPTHVVVNSVVNNAGDSGLMRERLEGLVEAIQAAGAVVLLVKEPSVEPIYGEHRWFSVEEAMKVVDAVAADRGAVLVDPIPTFHRHREEFLFLDDVHLTPRGHRLLARQLVEVLTAGAARAAPLAPDPHSG